MDVIELDKRATIVGMAQLLGISRQAVVHHLDKGHISRGQNFREQLHALWRHTSEHAAGRTGPAQEALTEARTREAVAKAEAVEMQNLERRGQLVVAEDVGPVLVAFMSAMSGGINEAVAKAVEVIESRYGIHLDDRDLKGYIRGALASAKTHASDVGKALVRGRSAS